MKEKKQKEKKRKKFNPKDIITFIKNFFLQTWFLIKFLILLFFVFLGYLIDSSSKEKLNKPKGKIRFNLGFIKPTYNRIYIQILKIFDVSKENEIKSSDLILLALKNLSSKKSRTYITVGGMAIGFGAVILLLSLGYGFERLVVSQIASLSEIKQVDVATSQGSPLSFNYDVIDQICQRDEIETALPTITAVAKVEYNNAVSDIITHAVTTRYIEESRIDLIEGELFDSSLDRKNPKITHKEDTEVAGVSTRLINTQSIGNEIYDVNYSIYPLVWKPVYSKPDINSEIVGYTKRGVGIQEAIEVWGSSYEGIDPENISVDYTGTEYGPWIKDTFSLWKKERCSMKDYDCIDAAYRVLKNGQSQLFEIGYITEDKTSVERFSIKDSSNLEVYKDNSIDNVKFRLKERTQTDMFFDSNQDSTRLTILNEDNKNFYDGVLTYGDRYSSEDNFFVESSTGDTFGYWVKADIQLWSEEECDKVCDIYYTKPESVNSVMSLLTIYFKIDDIEIDDLKRDLLKGKVLGESDIIGESSNFIDIEELVESDDDVDWVEIVEELGTDDTIEADIKPLPTDAQKVALVNSSMLTLLGISTEDAVGETFQTTFVFDSKLFNKSNYLVESEKSTYRIIGVVVDSEGPTFYIPYGDVLVEGMESVSNLKVILGDTKDVEEIRGYIESLGFQTSSVVDTIDQIGSLFSTLRIALLLLGLIALGVASLGMFNTLTVSLLEKTREVGLLKTMGMKSEEIKILFLAESIIISIMGGVSGVVVGFLSGKLFSSLISVLAVSQGRGVLDITYIPGLLIIGTVSLASVVGLLTGWYPAKRATKISALNALRYE